MNTITVAVPQLRTGRESDMSRSNADKAVKQARISGYHHHPYEFEKVFLRAFLNGDREILTQGMLLTSYADVLAPQPFRAMKNSAICMVAIICRAVIDYGVDAELSFSLSDYYINEIEKQTSQGGLQILYTDILSHFMDTVRKVRESSYSRPVVRSIRYIHKNLYKPCRVKEVAEYTGLHPAYLSSLFKSEVGMDMSRYIRDKKLEEAKDLLVQSTYTVTEIAEMLGFCDVAYFSNQYKKMFGISPKNFIRPIIK